MSASPTFLARLASSLLAYDGREYALLEAPLEPYFELAVIRKACALHDSADGLSQDEAARIRALKVGLDELHARQNTAPQSSGEQSPDALSVESNQVADTKP